MNEAARDRQGSKDRILPGTTRGGGKAHTHTHTHLEVLATRGVGKGWVGGNFAFACSLADGLSRH